MRPIGFTMELGSMRFTSGVHDADQIIYKRTAPPYPSRLRESCTVFVPRLRVPIRSPNRWTKTVHEDAGRLTDTRHWIRQERTLPSCPSRCRESCPVFVPRLPVPIPSPNRWTKAVHDDAGRLTDTRRSIRHKRTGPPYPSLCPESCTLFVSRSLRRIVRLDLDIHPMFRLSRQQGFVVQKIAESAFGRDRVADTRNQPADFRERFVEIRRDNHRFGLGVINDECELFWMQPEVDWHGCASQLEASIEGLEHLRAVVHEDRHMIAARHAQPMQSVGEPVRALVEARVCGNLPAVCDRRSIGEGPDGLTEGMADVHG